MHVPSEPFQLHYELVNTVANRIIEITPEGITDFSGTYEEFLARKKEQQEMGK